MTTLTELLDTPPRDHHEVEVSPGAVQATLDYLGSPGALASVARDPYWPKWESPWWHMALLHELRLSPLIPAALARDTVVAEASGRCSPDARASHASLRRRNQSVHGGSYRSTSGSPVTARPRRWRP